MCIFNTIKDWSLNLHVGKDIIMYFKYNLITKIFDTIVNVGGIYVKECY